jgi:hypothetical protein
VTGPRVLNFFVIQSMTAARKRIMPNSRPKNPISAKPPVAVPQNFTVFTLAGQPTLTLASPCHFAATQTNPSSRATAAERNRILDLIPFKHNSARSETQHESHIDVVNKVELQWAKRRTLFAGNCMSFCGLSSCPVLVAVLNHRCQEGSLSLPISKKGLCPSAGSAKI